MLALAAVVALASLRVLVRRLCVMVAPLIRAMVFYLLYNSRNSVPGQMGAQISRRRASSCGQWPRWSCHVVVHAQAAGELGGLLGQDMATLGRIALDLAAGSHLEALFAPERVFSFILAIFSFLLESRFYLFGTGERNIIMLRPSSLGCLSSQPCRPEPRQNACARQRPDWCAPSRGRGTGWRP